MPIDDCDCDRPCPGLSGIPQPGRCDGLWDHCPRTPVGASVDVREDGPVAEGEVGGEPFRFRVRESFVITGRGPVIAGYIEQGVWPHWQPVAAGAWCGWADQRPRQLGHHSSGRLEARGPGRGGPPAAGTGRDAGRGRRHPRVGGCAGAELALASRLVPRGAAPGQQPPRFGPSRPRDRGFKILWPARSRTASRSARRTAARRARKARRWLPG